MPLEIVIYTREGCGLCREAKEHLQDLSYSIPLTLIETDITSDPALERAMFERIPVIDIGSVRMEAPIDYWMLDRAVRSAARRKE
jgi:hypothetical protein